MRLPIRANEYLLNVKFINRLLCFSTKGERRTVKIKGLTRVWVLEKFQISRYLCWFQGSFVKFEYSCFCAFIQRVSLWLESVAKNFSFLESDSSCFSSL